MSFTILGTGSALPERIIKNDELTSFLDTSDEWIRTRTGIEERHVLGKDESVTGLTIKAAQNALDNAGVTADEIDFIIACTIGGDYITPALACLVQAGIGAKCPAVDINNGCSGFIYGLEAAAGVFARKKAKKVLLVAGEGLTRVTNWEDRSTCVLFGDGAAAVVLGEGDDLLSVNLTTQGQYDILYIPYPYGNMPERSGADDDLFIHMNGGEVYKFAVNAINNGVNAVLTESGLATSDINHLLLHQANLRIIEAAVKKLGLTMDACPVNINQTGNMSAVTIPLLMDTLNREGRFKKGDILVLSAFGAGLATGSAAIRWGK